MNYVKILTSFRMTKSVTFGAPPPYSEIDPASDAKPSLKEVLDLCASIQQLHKSTSIIGFSLDSKRKLRGAYPIDTTEAYVPSSELVTLEDLLDRHQLSTENVPSSVKKKDTALP